MKKVFSFLAIVFVMSFSVSSVDVDSSGFSSKDSEKVYVISTNFP